MGGHLLRRADGDHLPAAHPALRPQVDDPVGALHDVQVVLDHQQCVAALHQPLQHLHQLPDIFKVQACRRLVENVDGAPGGPLAQLARQFDALRLAARQRGAGLPDPHVAQPHVAHQLHLALNGGNVLEEIAGVFHRHVEHVTD